jgi:hypothetical protein
VIIKIPVALNEAGDKQFTNPILNKKIQYVDKDGEKKENLVGNLLRLAKNNPGRLAAEKMLPKPGTVQRNSINKVLGREKGGGLRPDTPKLGGDKQPETPQAAGQPKQVEPQQLFKSDPASIARLDKEKEINKKLAGTSDKPKIEPNDLVNKLKGRKDSEGNELDAETTKNGSMIIGVEHGKGTQSTKDTINKIKSLPKDTKVMFVGEGGMTKDDAGNIEFSGEQSEIRDAVKGHFTNSKESSWDENANIYDDNSPVFDEVAKSLGGSKSKSKAAIWSNMVGQGDDLDANDYLDNEGKKWLVNQAKKGGSGEFNGNTNWNNLTDEQKNDLYQLNFRDDDGYGETEISKAQEAYNGFRQKELDRKIKEAEADGYKVIAPVGNSHIDLYKKRQKKDSKVKQIASNIKEKISDWNEKDKEFFKQYVHKGNSPERRSWGEALKDKAKGAWVAIKKGLQHEGSEVKNAAIGMKTLVMGKKLSSNEVDAIKAVTKTIVTTILFGAAMGGLEHGVGDFAKHVAVEIVPHTIGEVIALGTLRAAINAGEEDVDKYFQIFIDKVAEQMTNMKITPEMMEHMVDSYNKKRGN